MLDLQMFKGLLHSTQISQKHGIERKKINLCSREDFKTCPRMLRQRTRNPQQLQSHGCFPPGETEETLHGAWKGMEEGQKPYIIVQTA